MEVTYKCVPVEVGICKLVVEETCKCIPAAVVVEVTC